MAKSWKRFVQKPAEGKVSCSKLSDSEELLKQSLQELAKTNKGLQKILEQRKDLEAKLNRLLHPVPVIADLDDPRYANEIVSIGQKQKEDKKRFEARRKLEAKIAEKNNEYDRWTKRRDKIKIKFSRDKELIERNIQQVDRGIKKTAKIEEDFDWEGTWRITKRKKADIPSVDRPSQKKSDGFPFEERLKPVKQKDAFEQKDNVQRKPSKKTTDSQVRKRKDYWTETKDKERDIQSLKNKQAQTAERKSNHKGLIERLEKIEKQKSIRASGNIQEKNSEKKCQAAKEVKRKQSLLEQIRAKRDKQSFEDKEFEKKEALKLKRIGKKREQYIIEAKTAERKMEDRRDALKEERKVARKNHKKNKYNE